MEGAACLNTGWGGGGSKWHILVNPLPPPLLPLSTPFPRQQSCHGRPDPFCEAIRERSDCPGPKWNEMYRSGPGGVPCDLHSALHWRGRKQRRRSRDVPAGEERNGEGDGKTSSPYQRSAVQCVWPGQWRQPRLVSKHEPGQWRQPRLVSKTAAARF